MSISNRVWIVAIWGEGVATGVLLSAISIQIHLYWGWPL